VKKHAYVHSGRFIGGYPHEIGLADHWSEDISKAYAEVSPESAEGGSDGGDGLTEDQQETLDSVAQYEAENRPLDFDIKGADHNNIPVQRAWNELSAIHSEGLLKLVYSSSSKPNRYRLTDSGWEKSTVDEPAADELSEKAKE